MLHAQVKQKKTWLLTKLMCINRQEKKYIDQ